MRPALPKLNLSKIIKITNALKKEELGLIKQLACKALVERDLHHIPEETCLRFTRFYTNSPLHHIVAVKKLEALKLVINNEDDSLTITKFTLSLAGYNGIDTDHMKKKKNLNMLVNDDLLSWYEFLKI